jgi:ribA/ribD-fused uncharacterized protein
MIEYRLYNVAEAASFLRARDEFGAFHNMASGYPFELEGNTILTSEHLYQAHRCAKAEDFGAVLAEPNGFAAKQRAIRSTERPDWPSIRVSVMRWALSLKLSAHADYFGELFERAGTRPIVEQSSKGDTFWGTTLVDNTVLVGRNVLGRLLMERKQDGWEQALPHWNAEETT